MKRLIFVQVLYFCSLAVMISQSNLQDLEKRLKSADDAEKYTILYRLSEGYLPTSAKKSAKYGEQALKIAEKLKNKNKQANALNLIGTAYYKQKKYRQAIKNYKKEYQVRRRLNQTTSSTKTLLNIGAIYETWGKRSKAVGIYNQALSLAKEYKKTALENQCYLRLIHLHTERNDHKDGFLIMREYLDFIDVKKISKESYKIALLETKYEEEKKLKEEVESKLIELDSNLTVVKVEKESLAKDTAQKSSKITNLTIETKEKEQKIKEEKAKVKRQQQWMATIGGFLLIIAIFLVLLFRLYKDKKKANQQLVAQNAEILEKNEEINAQADELRAKNIKIEESKEEIMGQAEQLTEALDALTVQRDEIQRKNMHIMDSINYAGKIQKAMLPMEKTIAESFSDFMILFLPQNVVSGDFYWFRKLGNYLVFVAADCTGHGVPGALMSMLGMSFLNEVVVKERSEQPDEILELLREKVKNSLKQSRKNRIASDGMDMSLCVLDTSKNLLHFAGANNPLYLIREKKLEMVKADPQPISIFLKEKEFTHHQIELQKNDCLYLFSDGYIDQFGGEHGDKFKSRRFKELLLKICGHPMSEQKIILEQILEDWMHGVYEQLDDILILGVKI